ncbi:tRNA uracil 4-sulfurtransferase ThiI [Clostridium vitabionis]|jgi:thiamine biosynthesis protein ThiI|uniref:tRNA uracil 4-sulfurtransferase ThiI n=1 Tax=Clostridium vitabionis TaxID=2784388 RepID=UPI00188A99C0|nr:tRNA uracil 4-sulfurtransferase ThiI [Clostridium vitabionis]
MFHTFLIKYAEIGIKGKNRYLFEDKLVSLVNRALKRIDGHFLVTKEAGRIYAEADGDFDDEEVIDVLTRVFGVADICPMMRVEDLGPEKLREQVIEYLREAYDDFHFTFKVDSRRINKAYPGTSETINADLGEALLEAFPDLRVDVHHPDVKVNVEIRKTGVNIYSKVIPGPGGLPVGTNGKSMLLLSGGIDSPVAGWMVAKRGVIIEAVYFHAPPYTSERAKEKVVDLAKLVARYSGPIRLHVVNFTDIQLYIYQQCPHDELTIIMRRYMMRIAEMLAEKNGCLSLVTGESIGQVASQTMQSLVCTDAACTMPVFRPLIAFDKQDIVEISEKIGTYETSIEPYEDCCTIFVAKHPVTKPLLHKIEKSEENLREKIGEMVKTAVDTEEVIWC